VANPQRENGHTDIANEIMDALAKIRIPGEARQVLDFILRKTYGWHKTGDHISLSQFRDCTLMKTPHISRALDKLQIMNLIVITNIGDTQKGNFIEFNKDFDTWKPLPKKVTLPKKIIDQPQKGNSPSPKKVDTKEIKEIKEKEISQGEGQPVNPIKPEPEPKAYVLDTPLQKVVCGYKMIQGFAKEDKIWDKAHYARCVKPAKILLEFFEGDYIKAVDCIEDLSNELKAKGLSWTLETIVKHSANYKLQKERGEYNGKAI